MDQSIVNELKAALWVIQITRCRAHALREDLSYFVENAEKLVHLVGANGALKRLEHEIMFLCVDVYGLHEGITKKKSFYSKIIKNNSKAFAKVDETPSTDKSNFIGLGIFETNSGELDLQEISSEEQDAIIEYANSQALRSREDLRKAMGIESHRHPDLDQWKNDLIDRELIEKLSSYRREFAHRLNSLENFKQELTSKSAVSMKEMIDIVEKVLEIYELSLQGLLSYTNSELFRSTGFRYDSLARMRQWDELMEK